jgi:hypothetical protein
MNQGDVYGVERVGDRRSCAILTPNFSMKTSASEVKRRKTETSGATEALRIAGR